MGQIGLFDIENKLSALSKMGDPLEKLDKAINWKSFKPVINKAFRKDRKSNAGRFTAIRTMWMLTQSTS